MLDDVLRRYLSVKGGHEERDTQRYSEEQWSALTGMGIVGALFREEIGGFAGLGTDIALVFEALGNHLTIGPFLSALMSGTAIAAAGSPPPLLEEVIAGSAVIAFAHEEAEPGMQTSAMRVESGWRLNGAKSLVLDAEVAHSFLVSASTEYGPALFLVLRDGAGVTVDGYSLIDGGRAGDIALDNVEVVSAALVGEAGSAASYIEAAEAAGLLALSAEALGAMMFIKHATVEYLRTRIQFGSPIGRFQALQHRVANLLIDIEQARSAVINAATAMEGPREVRDMLLSAAKFSVGEIGTRVAEEAIQLHGGVGMTWELPLSRFAKRLVMIDHQLGDSDHHLYRYMKMNQIPSNRTSSAGREAV